MDTILTLINNNQWTDAIKKSNNIFEPIIDQKNMFHIACIRGYENAINHFLELKSTLIFLSDEDGNTGAHLLAINGWDTILIKVIKSEPLFLQLKNSLDKFVYNYVLERQNTFYEIIKIMEKNKLTNYLNFVRNDGNTLLYDVIDMVQNTRSPNFEVFEFLCNLKHPNSINHVIDWNIPKNSPPLIYVIDAKKEDLCEYILDNIRNINVNVLNKNEISPLIASLYYKLEKISIRLIDMGADINFGGQENSFIPLSMSFKNWIPNVSKKLMEYDDLEYDKKDNLLNSPIYYLLDTVNNHKELLTLELEVIKQTILKSDLLSSNIAHVTPMHLLVKFNMWKEFKDILETKTFDINAFDKNKTNILEYLNDEDLSLFMEIIDKQIKSGKNNVKLIQTTLILPVKIKEPDNLDYGMFNADGIHNTMYILYMLDKYTNCTIPMQYPVPEKRTWDKYKLHTQFSPHDEILNLLQSVLSFYYDTFYSLVPHIIYWRNKTIYFKDKNLSLYLSRAIKSEKHRFIIVKLSLLPQASIMHANIIIYDKQRNTIVRFEPYGDWDLLDSYWLDKMLMSLFKKSINEERHKSLKYIRPTDYLNKTKFQSASLGDNPKNKNMGDPDGYCLAWCYWFIELKMLNPDVEERSLVENALRDIIKLSNENDNNPLLTHIRSYGKHLDNEKNKLFEKIGVNKYEFYKLSYDTQKLELCRKYVDEYISNKLTNI